MALTHLVVQYESNFCSVALQFMEEEKNYPLPSPATTGMAPPLRSLQSPTWPSARRDPLSEPSKAPQFCRELGSGIKSLPLGHQL